MSRSSSYRLKEMRAGNRMRPEVLCGSGAIRVDRNGLICLRSNASLIDISLGSGQAVAGSSGSSHKDFTVECPLPILMFHTRYRQACGKEHRYDTDSARLGSLEWISSDIQLSRVRTLGKRERIRCKFAISLISQSTYIVFVVFSVQHWVRRPDTQILEVWLSSYEKTHVCKTSIEQTALRRGRHS